MARLIAVLDGTEISYLEEGRGPPLVLLHGIGSAAQSWIQQLRGLSERFRVIAWDAPGYGFSTALDELAPESTHYAARLRGFLDERNVRCCHLVGHSLGALIAASFAAEYPRMIKSLTLASVATGHARLPAEERKRLLEGRLNDLVELGPRGMAEKRGPRLVAPHAPDEVRRAVIDTMASIRPDGYGQAVRMLSQGDIVADVARLPAEIPVQFVFGSEDVVTPPEQNKRVAAMRPASPVTMIQGAGHAVYLEQPVAFNAAIVAFCGQGHDQVPLR